MCKPFAVLADIAEKCGGFVLHGEPVNVRLISLTTVRKTFTGKALLKAGYALTVSGDDQKKLLDALDSCAALIMNYSGFFDTRSDGIFGSLSPQGRYCYTIEWNCMMFDGGD